MVVPGPTPMADKLYEVRTPYLLVDSTGSKTGALIAVWGCMAACVVQDICERVARWAA